MRLYQLARDLSLPEKSLIDTLQGLGLEIQSHLSSIEDSLAEKIRTAVKERERIEEEAQKRVEELEAQQEPAQTEEEELQREERLQQERERARKAAAKAAKERAQEKAKREARRKAAREKAAKRARAAAKRKAERERARAKRASRPSKISVTVPISVKEFSAACGVKVSQLQRMLLQDHGVPVRITDTLDEETVFLLGEDLGIEVEIKIEQTLEDELQDILEEEKTEEEELSRRAPIVTVLGHVDHGKTTLLDRIRNANVQEGEAGGITQHIASYRVETEHGPIVFVDTPGHEAFTEMRARGANVTDVVILVVAADDGVMPQTKEAISHAKAAEVPIMVALNKMDKPNANPEQVKGQLAAEELTPEEWGGETQIVPISALKGEGIDDLLERLILEAELLELTANPDKPAVGTCFESTIDEGRGILADVIVQDGTLHLGDTVLCGPIFGRVRALINDRGREIEEAGPSTPVQLLGFPEPPNAGERLYALEDEKKAKEIAAERARKAREKELKSKQTSISISNLFDKLAEAERKEAKVILKADVPGSIEVIKKALNDLSTDEVAINIIHSAIGGINESDVHLAEASDAIIVGFHVIPEDTARNLAEERGVEIKIWNVIYDLVDDMKKALEGLLEPEKKEVTIGYATVRKIFKSSQIGTIAGCHVDKGKITRNARVRLARNNIVIYEGELGSLKRFEDDVKEVREGFECGLTVKGYDDVKEGDRLVLYEIQHIARTLE